MINADDFYGADAYRILAAAFRDNPSGDGSEVFMVGYSLVNTLSPHGTVNRGLCTSIKGTLTSVREIIGIQRGEDGSIRGKTGDGTDIEIKEDSLVSMNFWGFYPGFLPLLENHFIKFLEEHAKELKSEFYSTTLVDTLLSGNEVKCSLLSTTAAWFGITYPEDKQLVQDALNERIKAGDYPSRLKG